MTISREHQRPVQAALAVLAWLSFLAADVAAFGTYADCRMCHPGFVGGVGAPLHNLHMSLTFGCGDCHRVPGDTPNIGLTESTGCVGCHGRSEDDIGQPLGGLGAGLRLHHENTGITCATCHAGDPVPVGEDVLPPFYVTSLGRDPRFDRLDNDGDLLVDGADPDSVGGGNIRPAADPNGPYTGDTGVALTLDGSASFDGDGTIVSYDWNFGDGNLGAGVSPDHTYATAGLYTVSLTVTDDAGASHTASTTADIIDVPEPPKGDTWKLISSYSFEQFTLRLEPFAGILMVVITEPSGASSRAIGMELDDLIFWMDKAGSIYFGNIDRTAGTMSGFSFGEFGGGIWSAERL
ncbi:MAG: PKD domain-containing protein [Pirellulaceae bacterium]